MKAAPAPGMVCHLGQESTCARLATHLDATSRAGLSYPVFKPVRYDKDPLGFRGLLPIHHRTFPTLDLSMASSSCTFGGLMLRHALAALISDHKGAHVSWAAAPNNLPASLCVIIITCPAPPSTLCTRQHESQCFLCRFAGQ